MSGGTACKCPEAKKPIEQRSWRVMTRYGNYSTFNGRRFTSSRYSAVTCIACRAHWRTTAGYVVMLGDWKEPA